MSKSGLQFSVKQLFIIPFLLINGHTIAFGQKITDCSSCNQTVFKENQLTDKSPEELNLLRNEIFARHGHVFKNEGLHDYFSQKIWYNPIDDNTSIILSSVEKQNIEIIKNAEKNKQKARHQIIENLKKLKDHLNEDKSEEIKKIFGNRNTDDLALDALIEVLDEVDLDDINWYKNSGLYSITIDNGFVVMVYSIKIQNEEIIVNYNYMSRSEIIEDFDEFTDYHSENEFSVFWSFRIKNSSITLENITIAG